MSRPLSSRTAQLIGLWSLALFVATLCLHLRHRDFAWFYHPDEPGKVEQVQTGKWNFHHPMLLLTASKLAVDVGDRGTEPQEIVETGRAVSATFSALAVVALSLLAFYWRGWPAALAAGGALMLHHQIFELSHYMKEDTALLLGMALVWLSSVHFERTPRIWLAVALGGSCALAISGKYIGVMALAAAAPVLWRAGKKRHALAFLGALLVVLAVVNWPLLANLETFKASLARETSFVVQGQKAMTRSVPHAEYWNIFIDNTTPAIWVLLLVSWTARWRERRALTAARWHIIAFPILYALALSFSPKSNDRYFLPATAAFTFMAALGVVDAARLLSARLAPKWVYLGAGAFLVLGQLPSWWRYEVAFQHDDSKELLTWVRERLPHDAVIAKDSRIWLPDPKKPQLLPKDAIPQEVRPAKFVADLGTLAELREKGITHAVISETDYGRFFRKSLQPKKGEEADYLRRRSFYESLLRDGVVLFEKDRGTVIYLHPGIRVYEIPKPAL